MRLPSDPARYLKWAVWLLLGGAFVYWANKHLPASFFSGY